MIISINRVQRIVHRHIGVIVETCIDQTNLVKAKLTMHAKLIHGFKFKFLYILLKQVTDVKIQIQIHPIFRNYIVSSIYMNLSLQTKQPKKSNKLNKQQSMFTMILRLTFHYSSTKLDCHRPYLDYQLHLRSEYALTKS